MSRLYDPEPPITVEVDDKGRPRTVTWQRREPAREVVITPAMVLEIYRDDITGAWYLRRVID